MTAASAAGTRRRWYPWILALLVLVIHFQRLGLDYFWDDTEIIVRNPVVQASPLGTWLSPMEPLRGPDATNYYRPLPFFLLSLAGHLGGFEPPTALNVLHLGVTFLLVLALFGLARKLVSAEAALAATALFIVFPTNLEALAWLSGLPDTLAVLFFVLFAGRLLTEVERPSPTALTLLILLGGLVSKEGSVAMLPFALLWDFPRLRREGAARLFRFHLPMWLVVWGFYLVRRLIVSYEPPVFFDPLLIVRTFGAYVFKLVKPWPFAMVIGDRFSIWDFNAVAGVILLAVMLAAALFARDRVVRFACVLFLAGFFPYANLWRPPGEFYLIAERYMLVHVVAAALLLVHAASRLPRPLPLLAAGVLVAGYGAVTISQYEVWKDEAKQWHAIIDVSPLKIGPYYRMARVHFNAGDLEAAESYAEKAVETMRVLKEEHNVIMHGAVNENAYKVAGAVAYALGKYDRALDYSRLAYQASKDREFIIHGVRIHDRMGNFDEALASAVRANEAFPDDVSLATLAIEHAVLGGRPELAWQVVNRSSYRYIPLVRSLQAQYEEAATAPAVERGIWMYARFHMVTLPMREFASAVTAMTATEASRVGEIAYREKRWPESTRYFELAWERSGDLQWRVWQGFALHRSGRTADACKLWREARLGAAGEIAVSLDEILEDCGG